MHKRDPVYNYNIHQQLNKSLQRPGLDLPGKDNLFYTRFVANFAAIHDLYMQLYGSHPAADQAFGALVDGIVTAFRSRPAACKRRDEEKQKKGYWFLDNGITGMSLYVDRFCGNLSNLENRLDYFKELGVNLLHLMPVFESPAGESDGGYAVSDFRKVDDRFGTLDELKSLQKKMRKEKMYLMVDIVLNHTSQKHAWAQKARDGDAQYQDYFYMYDDRSIPDTFENSMPEIFPEAAPGNFTWVPGCNKWVMTVFHNYQWDLNYTNPSVLVAMLENIFFYANLGVDILRIDAPAFIWKQIGTPCQNLPEAHFLLQLIKQCVQVAAPGMALLGEAIVAPAEILKYFGTGVAAAKECDFAYNATQMALQWDALATGDIKVMYAAQELLLRKPYGTSWITYTRCHDDIGLGYNDYMIRHAGYDAYQHRNFIKNYYTGRFESSWATGALFSSNPRTGDARISGSLASLCGLEKAIDHNDNWAINTAIKKIILMQAHSFFLGGIPMLFYGDEAAYTNDYSYLNDPGKSYDNRWMHRPITDWEKNEKTQQKGTIEHSVFSATQKLIALRKKFDVMADHKNLTWITPHNRHVAVYMRSNATRRVYCLFNFSSEEAFVTWYTFKDKGSIPHRLYDYWNEQTHTVGPDHEYLIMAPYTFCLVEEQ